MCSAVLKGLAVYLPTSLLRLGPKPPRVRLTADCEYIGGERFEKLRRAARIAFTRACVPTRRSEQHGVRELLFARASLTQALSVLRAQCIERKNNTEKHATERYGYARRRIFSTTCLKRAHCTGYESPRFRINSFDRDALHVSSSSPAPFHDFGFFKIKFGPFFSRD